MSEDRTKVGTMGVRGQTVDVFASIRQYGGKGEPRGRFEADIGRNVTGPSGSARRPLNGGPEESRQKEEKHEAN